MADLRHLSRFHGTFDLVLACDNAVPHLLTDGEIRPYGVRQSDGKTFVLFQVWAWDPPYYDLALCIMEDTGGDECPTHVYRTRYFAVAISYQPVLVGTRPLVA